MSEGVDTASLDQIQAIIGEEGYEVAPEGENLLRIREVDSGIVIRAVLEENILFLAVSCMTIGADAVTPDLMRKMLASDNGISTSSFQLYDKGDNSTVVTLNNFCKLQSLGADDQDDILSCLEFLVVDVMAAKSLLENSL